MINTEDHYEFTTCPRDGSMWLEQIWYKPATRWEPEDVDVDDRPCPTCGSERDEPLNAHDAQYGGFALAALEAARWVAWTIESLAVPRCERCGVGLYDWHPCHDVWES